MNMLKKNRLVIAAVIIAAVSTVLYAAFTFNPVTSSQPTTTLAPFALSKNDFSTSGGYAYQPWFENGAWQGDLIEYYVCGKDDETDPLKNCTAGERTTDAEVGSNPPVATGANWMARYSFAQKEGANPITRAYWHESATDDAYRHIFTVNTETGKQEDFRWDKLSVAQKLALDSNIADPNGLFSQDKDPSVATGTAYSSPVLNFIRGDRSNEKSYKGGTYRIRYSLLGDIINSNPEYIGAPRESYDFGDFPKFKSDHVGRSPRIAVGANDGLLHVFDADTGYEVYAYLPSMLIIDPDATINSRGYPVFVDPDTGNEQLAESKLNQLRQVPYNHTYFVDGRLTAASAQLAASGIWKTILAGGLGAGARGLFALDVTSPYAQDAKVLFEKTDDDVGHIYGQPVIARLGDGKWYIVTGNGFGSKNAKARLLLISLDDYSMTSIGACEGVSSCTPAAEGLAAAALVDTNGDSRVDIAFAGDDSGNMWRFNLDYYAPDPDMPDDKVANFSTTNVFTGSADRPITSAPEIGAYQGGGYMVYFGTGTIAHTPSSSSYPTQAIYGIWDRAPGTKIVSQPLSSTIVDKTKPWNKSPNVFNNDGQTLADGTTTCTLPIDTTKLVAVRYFDKDKVNTVDFCGTADSSCAKGWMVELKDIDGERVLDSPKLRAGRLTMVTNGPGPAPELRGDSWLMSLDYLTGGDADKVVFDANLDDSIDDCDRETGGYAPVGMDLGDGNIAQPVLGRLGVGQDQMFINGLRLPVILSQSILGGHLDVETDSPFGGTTAPNTNSQHSEGYNIVAYDGAGRGVDGHFHQYDDVNGVTYVDLFQLEPLRGKASLAAKILDQDSCPDGYFAVTGTTTTSCVQKVVPELNRAFDTLTDPLTDQTMPKSEVYGDSTHTKLLNELKDADGNDKEFIIVLANADLTPAAKLQIGCREWDVKDYQDILTEQLEANISPSALVDYATYADKSISKSRPGGLVFSLKGIAGESGGVCDKNNPPGVRVKFTYRSIIDNGVIGTRAQCVLGLHDYHDKVCYSDEQVLSHAPKTSADFPATYFNPYDSTDPTGPYDSFNYTSCQDDRFVKRPPYGPWTDDPKLTPYPGYIRDPDRNLHITESSEGENGRYRWRNGALTVQFIDVDSFKAAYSCSAASYNDGCPLQNPKTLPKSTTGKKKRFGGTYARAFEILTDTGKDVMTPYLSTDTRLTGNGLLYESTIFWHYGELAENLRRAPPSSIPCYGDTDYNGSLSQEVGGLVTGEYNDLIANLGNLSDPDSLISKYAKALENLQSAKDSGNQDYINQAVLDLGNLLKNPDLAKYNKYRDYAPGHVPESQLLGIDKDMTGDGGKPSKDTKLKELLDKQSLGPNLTAGRRSWIDLSD